MTKRLTVENDQSGTLVVQVDPVANAAYVRLTGSPIFETREVNDWTLVDLDKTGELVGIEILGLTSPIPVETLEADFQLSSETAGLLKTVARSIGGIWSHGVTPDSVRVLGNPILRQVQA